MMRLLLLTLTVLIAAACQPTPSGSGDDHWQSLFNGRDLSGWAVKCKPADQGKTWWTVDQGTILADSMAPGKHDYIWLVSEREYGDFVLKLKFMAYRESPGNSGVQIRSRYDDAAGWLDGPQIDINPPGPWRTGMIWDETRGNQRWLYPDVPRGQWVNQKQGAAGLKFFYADDPAPWNELEVTARGLAIRAVLNGVTITDYNGAGVLDDTLHQERKVGRRAPLALQIHTGDQLRIRFKDLLIRELEP